MITYFQDYDTDRILSAPDINIAPNKDEHRLEDTIYFLNTAKNHYASTVELDACLDWLKSIEQRMEE